MEYAFKLEVLKHHSWALGKGIHAKRWHIWEKGQKPTKLKALCGYRPIRRRIAPEIGDHWTRHQVAKWVLCPKCKKLWREMSYA